MKFGMDIDKGTNTVIFGWVHAGVEN